MAITAKQLVEDLSVAMEVGGYFGYALANDGESILVEEYEETGQICGTYIVTINVKEN